MNHKDYQGSSDKCQIITTHDITHKLVWKILPHVFEDAFFRTVLSAEFPLLNTILQIAKSDDRPLVLKIHLNIFFQTSLFYKHFLKTKLLLARRKTGSGICTVWLTKREWGTFAFSLSDGNKPLACHKLCHQVYIQSCLTVYKAHVNKPWTYLFYSISYKRIIILWMLSCRQI